MNLKEFSKRIGINPSTISRALNDYPDISQKTKDTILKLAKKHSYKPNLSAQSIGSIKSKTSFKVLIADKISDASFKIFKDNNILIDKKYNLTEDQILSIISNYDGIVVRSSTKVTKKIIEKSNDGLMRRNIKSDKGNESTFLEPLKRILESGKSPAEMWENLFFNEWNNDIDMLYETNYFKVLENEKV